MRFILALTVAGAVAQPAAAQVHNDMSPIRAGDIGCNALRLAENEPPLFEERTQLMLVSFLAGAYAIRDANGVEVGGYRKMIEAAIAICDANPTYNFMQAVQMTGSTINWQAMFDEDADPATRRAALEDGLRENEEQRAWLEAELAKLAAD